jgi:hypothetical protein
MAIRKPDREQDYEHQQVQTNDFEAMKKQA